jgi:hypothetical protein
MSAWEEPMPPRDLVRSRRIACLVGALGAAALACTQLEWTKAHAQGVNRADALAQALVDNAPRHVPKGYASARGSRTALNDDDRRAGMAAGVQVALGGGDPKGSLRYGLFPSEQQAAAFARDLVQRTPRGSALKFLQYLPSADCADTPNGGLCSLRIGDVVIIATASQVDRGASLVLLAAKEALEAETANLRASPVTATPTPRPGAANARDSCALLTKADAAAALGGPVADPRQSSDSCYYGTQVASSNSVTLQLIEGGRSKFDFDRGRMQRIVGIPGIGDDAFAFASDAGFVQVYFIKGNGYASLTLQNTRDANRLESAKALARRIAARL